MSRKKRTKPQTCVPASPYFDAALDWHQYTPAQRRQIGRRFPLLSIAESKHGLGIFATQFIPAGIVLGPVEGRIITDCEYGSDRAFSLPKPWGVIEPGPPMAYMNHSCEPNCEQQLFPQAAGPTMIAIVTTHDVQAGEELFHDYHWYSDVPCGCGTRSCRGYI